MTQQSAATTVLGLLSRAAALFTQADQELARGLGRNVDEDHMSNLYRANLLFNGASAGARIAQAMVGAEHLDLLREFEERVEARSEGFMAAARTISDDDDRPPYLPPTLEGPYDPDRVRPHQASYEPSVWTDREHDR